MPWSPVSASSCSVRSAVFCFDASHELRSPPTHPPLPTAPPPGAPWNDEKWPSWEEVTYRDEAAAPAALSAGRAALDSMAEWGCCANSNSKRPSLLAVAPDDHGVCWLASIDREVEVNWPQDCNWRERFAEVGSTRLPLPARAPVFPAAGHWPGGDSALALAWLGCSERAEGLQWLSHVGCGLTCLGTGQWWVPWYWTR